MRSRSVIVDSSSRASAVNDEVTRSAGMLFIRAEDAADAVPQCELHPGRRHWHGDAILEDGPRILGREQRGGLAVALPREHAMDVGDGAVVAVVVSRHD